MNEAQALAWLDQNVSRETFERLQILVEELQVWNRRINLVAPSTLAHIWVRHVVDSAQLFALAPETTKNWLDLGSGAGFPGLVLGIMLRERADSQLVCVESNGKKVSFLRHVARKTQAPVKVENQRIEAVNLPAPDIITARALASLDDLLNFCGNLMSDDTILLFPKGRDSKKEVKAAQEHWQFDLQEFPSISDPDGHVLRLQNLKRR